MFLTVPMLKPNADENSPPVSNLQLSAMPGADGSVTIRLTLTDYYLQSSVIAYANVDARELLVQLDALRRTASKESINHAT